MEDNDPRLAEMERLRAQNQRLFETIWEAGVQMGALIPPEVREAQAQGLRDLKELLGSEETALYTIKKNTFLPARQGDDGIWRRTDWDCGGILSPSWRDKDNVMQDTQLRWDSVPNEAMVPANDHARAVFAAWRLATTECKTHLKTWERKGRRVYPVPDILARPRAQKWWRILWREKVRQLKKLWRRRRRTLIQQALYDHPFSRRHQRAWWLR